MAVCAAKQETSSFSLERVRDVRDSAWIDLGHNGTGDIADLIGIDKFHFGREKLFMQGWIERDWYLEVIRRGLAVAIHIEP